MSTEQENNVEVAGYEMLAEVPILNEEGNQIEITEIGSIQEVPVELGDAWVEQGLAVKATPTQVEVSAEETTIEEVHAPDEEVVPSEDSKLIGAVEEAELNKKVAAVAHAFFQNLAQLSAEEIYTLSLTTEGKDSPKLLELINACFKDMIVVGGDLPTGHFDSYKKIITDFANTLAFYIDEHLNDNKKHLIAKIVGKEELPMRVSPNDIIAALNR